ncbi:MAG: hypothetical protein ABI623_05955 [bacterium]
MANTTIGFGVALVLLGLFGYFGAETRPPTALIPAAFGFLLITFGIIARNEKMRKHAMHGAAVVGVLGFIGTMSALWQSALMIGGQTVERPEAVIAKSIMALLCLAFVILTVKSFIAARRSRKAAG